MKTKFAVEIFGQTFTFHTMNVKRLQLFQVYVMEDSKRLRFHMAIDENSEFRITDKHGIPQQYWSMESLLSDAILQNAGERTT